jgi:hypothetical protein
MALVTSRCSSFAPRTRDQLRARYQAARHSPVANTLVSAVAERTRVRAVPASCAAARGGGSRRRARWLAPPAESGTKGGRAVDCAPSLPVVHTSRRERAIRCESTTQAAHRLTRATTHFSAGSRDAVARSHSGLHSPAVPTTPPAELRVRPLRFLALRARPRMPGSWLVTRAVPIQREAVGREVIHHHFPFAPLRLCGLSCVSDAEGCAAQGGGA